MRREPEFFGDGEMELIQVSRKLKEAQSVEDALTEAGIDYVVQPEPYQGRMLYILPTARIGAFFYVPVESSAPARELLDARGFVLTIPDRPS